MKIYRVVVGPIQENCYIIKNEANNEGIIVDPGDEADRIMDAVKKAGIEMNRKSISELAIHEPAAFAALVEVAKKAL